MDDLIRREDALKAIDEWINSKDIALTTGIWKLQDRINAIPAVKPRKEE